MSSDSPAHPCDRYRVVLTRLACDGGEPSADLSAHLANCRACRRALADEQALAAALRRALAPAPVSVMFAERVAAQLDQTVLLPVTGWLRPWRIGAAAAILLVFALVPWWALRRGGEVPRFEHARLSAAEAAVVTSALAALSWDSPADYCTDGLSQQIAELSRLISGQTVDRGGCLPWSAEDDWDRMPLPERGGQLPGSLFQMGMAVT